MWGLRGDRGVKNDASAFRDMKTTFYLFIQPFSMHFQLKTTENPYFCLYGPAFDFVGPVMCPIPPHPTYGDARVGSRALSVRLQPLLFAFYLFSQPFSMENNTVFMYICMKNDNHETSQEPRIAKL